MSGLAIEVREQLHSVRCPPSTTKSILKRLSFKPFVRCLVAVCFCVLCCSEVCFSRDCTEKVKSQDEAKQAIAAFFNSDSAAARRLILELRKDGMTEEYLVKLKGGCSTRYIYRGEQRQNEESDTWYVISSIVDPTARKTRRVILAVECAQAIWLSERLYEG